MTNFLKKILSGKKKISKQSLKQLNQNLEALGSYIQGIELYKQDNYKEAINYFNTALQCGLINESGIFQYRGICFQKIERHPSAIKDLNKYIEINPNNWEAYNFRAQSFKEMNDFKNQYSDLQEVKNILVSIKRRTEFEDETLSNISFEMEKSKITIEYHENIKKTKEEIFEDILENARKKDLKYNSPDSYIPKRIYDPSYEQALKMGIKFDKGNDFTLALEYYDYAVQKNTNDAEAYSFRAFCLQALGYYLDSIEDFTKAIQLSPQDPNSYFGRSNSYVSLKNYSAAVEDGEKAIYYASLNNPLYEAYNDEAKDKGFKSAESLYESYVRTWRILNKSEIGNKLDDLYEKAIKKSDTAMINFYKEQKQKNEIEREKVMKRRNY
jgi:tetratricopeptide (TPR) repeat protein